MRILSALLLIICAQAVGAGDFRYKHYRHEPFRHLEFDVLTRWIQTQDGLVTAFIDPVSPGPSLYLQTLQKTEEFQDAQSFLEFLKQQGPVIPSGPALSATAGSFPAITFEYPDPESSQPYYVYSLIVDVGEGILWFYLSVPEEHAALFKPVLERVQATFSFR